MVCFVHNQYKSNNLTYIDIDDYVSVTGEDLQFGRGLSRLRSVSIPIVNDSIVETTEFFSALLTTATAGVTLAPNQSLIYILDNGSCLLCAVVLSV